MCSTSVCTSVWRSSSISLSKKLLAQTCFYSNDFWYLIPPIIGSQKRGHINPNYIWFILSYSFYCLQIHFWACPFLFRSSLPHHNNNMQDTPTLDFYFQNTRLCVNVLKFTCKCSQIHPYLVLRQIFVGCQISGLCSSLPRIPSKYGEDLFQIHWRIFLFQLFG